MSDVSEPREPDVVDKALRAVDHALDVVHDRVLRPILIAGRAVAFGFIIALMALVFVLALVIGLIRLLNVYAFAGHEWITYALVGFVSLTAGLIIWRKRRPAPLRK